MVRWIADGNDWQEYPNVGQDRSNLDIVTTLRLRRILKAGVPQNVDIEFPYTAYRRDLNSKMKHVWLELTNACNLTCGHCYAKSSPRADRTTELNDRKWASIIDSLATVGVDTITYIGGEPTLRLKEIATLCSVVREKLPKTRQRIFSNLAIRGAIQKVCDLALEYDLEIGTSLYGVKPDQHDNMTKHIGSWSNTVEAIRILNSSSVNLFVGFYLSEDRVDGRREAEAWLRRLGVSRFRVLSPSQVGRGAEKDWKIASGDTEKPPVKLEFPIDARSFTAGHNCFKDHLAISAEGEIRPCIMMRETSYGSLKQETDLKSLLATSEFQKFSELSKEQIDGCSVCEFRYGCFDCRPDAMGKSDNLYAKPNCGYDPRM